MAAREMIKLNFFIAFKVLWIFVLLRHFIIVNKITTLFNIHQVLTRFLCKTMLVGREKAHKWRVKWCAGSASVRWRSLAVNYECFVLD